MTQAELFQSRQVGHQVVYEPLLRQEATEGRPWPAPALVNGIAFESQVEFETWVHTDAGRWWANLFIRIAWGLKKRWHFQKYGAKAIYERMRWHYQRKRENFKRNGREVPARLREYKLNNNFTSRLARFAMDRAPELQGFFELRRLHDGEGGY